jgi:hypothetical protein
MEHFNGIPWMKIEMGICGLWTMFFFASGIALAVKIRYSLAQPLKILKINNLRKKNVNIFLANLGARRSVRQFRNFFGNIFYEIFMDENRNGKCGL